MQHSAVLDLQGSGQDLETVVQLLVHTRQLLLDVVRLQETRHLRHLGELGYEVSCKVQVFTQHLQGPADVRWNTARLLDGAHQVLHSLDFLGQVSTELPVGLHGLKHTAEAAAEGQGQLHQTQSIQGFHVCQSGTQSV